MAMYMANHRYAEIKVGPFLAVHGAVLPHIADKYTIPQINQLQRDFLTGKTPWNREMAELFESPHGIMWSRAYSGPRLKL